MSTFDDIRVSQVQDSSEAHPLGIQTRREYLVGNDFFVTFNTGAPPEPPSRTKRLYYPQDFYVRPSWFMDNFPFAPFSLRYHPWNEPTFEVLRGTKRSFPVVHSVGEGYALDSDLQKKWWRLEQCLISLYENVLKMRPNFLHPLDLTRVRHPYEWGYMRPHASEELARVHILNSRDSFVLLIALCTYAIAIVEGQSASLVQPYRSLEWVTTLIDKHGANSVWVDNLKLSHFLSTKTLRAGVYVNWDSFNAPHILQLYLNYGVPIWIRMPKNPTDMKLHSNIRLTSAQVSTLVRQQKQQQQQQQQRQQQVQQQSQLRQVQHQPPALSSIMGDPQKKNEPPSRQRHGETALEFIARNILANDRLASAESEMASVIRFDRERNAAKFICPGTNGPLVFEWVDSVRTYVPRSEVPNIWESYARSQKWYNGHRNEWDLCTELDPFAVVGSDDDEEDDYDAMPHYTESIDVPPVVSKDIGTLSCEQVEDTYSQAPPTSSTVTTPVQEELLFYRYGFHPDGRQYALPSIILDEKKAARALAESTLTVADYRQSAIHFVSYLASDIGNVPSPLRDLDYNNSTPLRSYMSHYFVFEVLGDNAFQIKSSSQSSDALLVPYPSQVVETLRLSNCTSIQALALYFATQGSWFHMGVPSNGLSPFGDPKGFNGGLGFRHNDFQLSWVDYQAYVDRRNGLLKEPSIVRAALMKGGIIWRITIESIQANYGSIDLAQFFANDIEIVELSKFDLGIIVGLYLIWTGQSNIDKEASWWPQNHHWNSCGLDVRYWSSFSEIWYTHRLDGIRKLDFKARSASEWGKALRFYKETYKVVKNNERASMSFLRSLESPSSI